MHTDFQPCVYLLGSKRNGTLYTGVTSNLLTRIQQYRDGLVRGFTGKYGVKLLFWFEQHPQGSLRSPGKSGSRSGIATGSWS